MRRIGFLIVLILIAALPLQAQDGGGGSIDVIRTLDSAGDLGYSVGMVIGTNGYPVISHGDNTNGDLKLIVCGDSTCDPATNIMRVLDSAGFVGLVSDIAINSTGSPVVAYWDATNDNLKLVACGDPTCNPTTNTVRTIDNSTDVGIGISIAIGANGAPVVSYYDRIGMDLKVVVCGDPTCNPTTNTIRTLDSTGNVGVHTGIAIGTDNNPVISYFDDTNDDLKLVVCGDPTCNPTGNTIRILDGFGTMGRLPNIVIGSSGSPLVSYYDSANDRVKLVVCGDPTCNPTTNTIRGLNQASQLGNINDLALDPNGLPRIVFRDPTNDHMQVLLCGDPTCDPATNTVIMPDGNQISGSSTTIAINPDGVPVVAYNDGVVNDLGLKFALVDSVRPETITRVFPTEGETLNVPLNSILWGAVDGIEFYGLQIQDAGGAVLLDGWVDATEACDSAGLCAVHGDSQYLTFPSALINGGYTLAFRTYDLETDTTSAFDTPTPFSIAAPAPVVTILQPQDPLAEPLRTFEWQKDPAAQWYNVRLIDSASELVNEWVYARDVCQDTVCTYAAPALNTGTYTLEISAWGPGVTGTSYPRATQTINIAGNLPAAVTLGAPAEGAVIPAGSMALQWAAAVDTLWYRVTILNPRGGVVGEAWHDGAEICAAGICSLPVELVPGPYQVRIAGWNPAGIGPIGVTGFTVTP
jgi:hypothetical protein